MTNIFPRQCVYTALTGGYEGLLDQPITAKSTIPFICFTDNPEIKSNTWQVRHVTQVFNGDNIRNQRHPKIRAHAFLPDFDRSLYIDNNVILRQTPEQIFNDADLISGMSLPWHSHRETVAKEFSAIITERLDDPARVNEQLAHYKATFEEVLQQRPFWNAILIRDHHHPTVVKAMDTWFSHVCRYSRRDQLSANVAFHIENLKPSVMEINNFGSNIHNWVNVKDRKVELRKWMPPKTD